MRNVITIGWYDVTRVLRERESLFWLFVGPLIFTTFFGLVMRPTAPRPPALAVVSEDDSDRVMTALVSYLSDDGIAVTASPVVRPGRTTLVVPNGAASALDSGGAVRFVLHAQAEETNAERSVRFKIQKAATRVYFDVHGGARAKGTEPGPLVVVGRDIGIVRRGMTAGFQRSVPAYLVMFVFLNLLVSGAGIAEDRASGRLRRMAMAPVSSRDIVLGKLLGRFAIGWIQIVYMLGFGFVVGITWSANPWLFLAFLSIFALATASLGILLGTLFTDPDKCASTAVWVAIVLSPLGGLWWPLEIVGPTLRRVAYFVPTGWAMEGVNAMLAFGAGAAEVAPFAAAFVAVFLVAYPLAARRLRV